MAAQESQRNYGRKLVNKFIIQVLNAFINIRNLKLSSFQSKIYCFNSRDKLARTPSPRHREAPSVSRVCSLSWTVCNDIKILPRKWVVLLFTQPLCSDSLEGYT